MKACEGLLIVASQEALANIPRADAPRMFPDLSIFECRSEDLIPHDLISQAKVIVVEVEQESRTSIDRLIELGRTFPDIPRIAAIANASVPFVRTLMHEGVADVVSIPFQFEEVLDVAARTIELARKQQEAEVGLAPIVSVLRSASGCGSTSVATHLAADLLALLPGGSRLAIVDLDLQSGLVADYLGASGSGSISDLLQAGSRLDNELLQSVERTSASGLSVFAAPDRIEPIENVETDQVLKVLTMMRRTYAGLVLDLPADWTSWSLSAVSMSDLIVLVVELNVSSLRQAKRQLELFVEVGIDASKIAVVVNRVERRLFKAIDLSDVDQTLRCEVLGTVALEDQQLGSAQTQGLLVQQISRKSKFNSDINVIAHLVHSRLPSRES